MAKAKQKTKEKTGATARKPKTQPADKPAYQHLTKVRCPRCAGTMVKSLGTRNDGRTKRWECKHPICRHRWETIGKPL